MTTMNTNERDERLKQVRHRASRGYNDQGQDEEIRGDVDFLLSLLDSQANEPATYYNKDGSYNPVGRNIADHAATRMREACVAAVKALPDHSAMCGVWLQQVCDCSFRAEVVAALKSLTLDQVE